VRRLDRWEDSSNSEDPVQLRNEMKKVMQASFGVFRDADPMKSGLKELKELQERLQRAALKDKSKTFNMARFECLELDNLMSVAVASATCAENRTESRGAHSRYDFKNRNDEDWLKHSLYFEDGRISYRSVNMMPKEIEPFPLKERE
jgi:succinate dehydrogenase / fumarate reductase, flavoprotein subunit